jgi:hypothetical protein
VYDSVTDIVKSSNLLEGHQLESCTYIPACPGKQMLQARQDQSTNSRATSIECHNSRKLYRGKAGSRRYQAFTIPRPIGHSEHFCKSEQHGVGNYCHPTL